MVRQVEFHPAHIRFADLARQPVRESFCSAEIFRIVAVPQLGGNESRHGPCPGKFGMRPNMGVYGDGVKPARSEMAAEMNARSDVKHAVIQAGLVYLHAVPQHIVAIVAENRREGVGERDRSSPLVVVRIDGSILQQGRGRLKMPGLLFSQ